MLDAGLKTQLTTYLQNLRQPIELVASLDDSAGSAEMKALLEDIVATSDKVTLSLGGDNERKPSFAITRAAPSEGFGDADVRFAGLPLGLAHQVRLVRPVRAGQSLTWADVAIDTTTRAWQVRREMETLFAPPPAAARRA